MAKRDEKPLESFEEAIARLERLPYLAQRVSNSGFYQGLSTEERLRAVERYLTIKMNECIEALKKFQKTP